MPREPVSGVVTANLEPVAKTGAPGGLPHLIRLTGAARAWPIVRPLSLGRGTNCEVVLDDAALSRSHASVIPTEGGIQVMDLDSRNGTFLDGTRIRHAMVGPRGILRVGQTLLRICPCLDAWEPARAEGALQGGTSLLGVRRSLELVAPTELPVLISGETGTGKEVVAKLLHERSGRSGAFVPVNCAALPESLAESELFGHARGAFTGATQAKKGLFLAAAGGTLFLDELGELPPGVQTKLLRVLEDHLVRPVGGEQATRVDVRVIAATNRHLPDEVAAGRFRSDLYARLALVELRLPALRDRLEDLPALAAALLARAGRPATRLSVNALEALLLYDWPRNVRELDGVMRAALLGSGDEIDLPALPAPIREPLHRARQGPPAPKPAAAGDLRARLEQALDQHRGNVRRVCQAVGISRGHFYRLLKQWDLDLARYRGT
jgi:DNA-binding NtrC family response regulator